MKSLNKVIAILTFILTLNGGYGIARDNCRILQLRNFNEAKIDSLPSDSLARYLTNLNVSVFYNAAVDSFLSAIPNAPMSMAVSSCQMGKTSMYNACFLQVAYYPDITLRVYVDTFTHMSKYSSTLSWDINLFKLEAISKISVYKDGKCVNGFCRNPN